jgi:hypothetical protein
MSILSPALVFYAYMFCDFTGKLLQNDHAVFRSKHLFRPLEAITLVVS